MMCSTREIAVLVYLSVVGIATTTPKTTPTLTTIGPTTPPGSCEYNGQIHENGAVLEDDPYKCSGATCEDGNVQYWDAECMFYTPVCYGTSEKVLGQCCPVCHNNVTTTPTTIPPTGTPPGGCRYNGKTYENGANIETDPNKCHGLYCQDGQIVAWDDECAFRTPSCTGWTEQVAGQCCPVCRTTTKPPRTTTPVTPTDGCLVDGKVYANGDIISKDPNNCFGSECSYGNVLSWERSCHYPPMICEGGWLNITGQCCKVCANVTTQPPETTCYIGNRRFNLGQRTNSDPCYECKCAVDGTEKCSNVTCDAVLDCDVRYKPAGTCCFTCGSSPMMSHLFLISLLYVMSERFRHVCNYT